MTANSEPKPRILFICAAGKPSRKVKRLMNLYTKAGWEVEMVQDDAKLSGNDIYGAVLDDPIPQTVISERSPLTPEMWHTFVTLFEKEQTR